jgi:hypothetical protein
MYFGLRRIIVSCCRTFAVLLLIGGHVREAASVSSNLKIIISFVEQF